MNSQSLGRAGLVLAAMTLSGLLGAQKIEIPDWENAVIFDVVVSQDKVRPGDEAQLAVLATIQPGYHLYGPEEAEPSRTVVAVEGDGLTFGAVDYPEVIRRDLSGLGEFDLYEGEVAIRVPMEAQAANSSELPATVTVNFQICTDYACSAPDSETLTVPIKTAPSGSSVKALHPKIFKR